MDTGGELIDFINCFVNKKLFTIANNVKILFPIPFDQLKLNRCGSVLEQVSVLLNMCEESPANMINSVLPLITKCKKVSEDNDDPDEAVDLELVKGQLQECFAEELKRRFRDLQHAFPDLENTESEAKDEDQLQQLNKMKSVDEFFKKYVMSVCVFDPLDREIPHESNDQTTKRDQIVEKIQSMPSIPGSYLVVPLSNRQIQALDNLFEKEKEECNQVIEEIREQIEKDSSVEITVAESPKIKEFL